MCVKVASDAAAGPLFTIAAALADRCYVLPFHFLPPRKSLEQCSAIAWKRHQGISAEVLSKLTGPKTCQISDPLLRAGGCLLMMLWLLHALGPRAPRALRGLPGREYDATPLRPQAAPCSWRSASAAQASSSGSSRKASRSLMF